MPNYFFDTSVLTKLYHEEAGTDFVERLVGQPSFVLNIATSPIWFNVVNLSLFDETHPDSEGQSGERSESRIVTGIDPFQPGHFSGPARDCCSAESLDGRGCPRCGGAVDRGEMAAFGEGGHMSAAGAVGVDPGPVDHARMEATSRLNPARRIEFGQFMTPDAVARFMASLFSERNGPVRLLDAGAGIGSLTAAFIRRWESERMAVSAYEIDPALAVYLRDTAGPLWPQCFRHGHRAGLH